MKNALGVGHFSKHRVGRVLLRWTKIEPMKKAVSPEEEIENKERAVNYSFFGLSGQRKMKPRKQ